MMTQTALDFSAPLARRSDPSTSHVAADKAQTFKARHIAQIWNCLKYRHPFYVEDGLTPREISEYLELEYHAVQRRGAEMERRHLITRGPDVRDGMKVWRAK